MVAGVETPEEIARPRQRGHGACGNGAVNAGVALTAPLVPSPIGVSVALPIGSAIVPPAFCRTLVHRGAFLRSMCFPPFSTICVQFRRRSDTRSKGHGADKFSAEFSARISPLDELIRGRCRRCIEAPTLSAGGSIVPAASKREAHGTRASKIVAHRAGKRLRGTRRGGVR